MAERRCEAVLFNYKCLIKLVIELMDKCKIIYKRTCLFEFLLIFVYRLNILLKIKISSVILRKNNEEKEIITYELKYAIS